MKTFRDIENFERRQALTHSRYVIRLGDALATIMPIVSAIDSTLATPEQDEFERHPIKRAISYALYNKDSHWQHYSWILDNFDPAGGLNPGDPMMYDSNPERPIHSMTQWLSEDDALRLFSEPIAKALLLAIEGKTSGDLPIIGQHVDIVPTD